jgi:hypothetical protein
MRGAEFQLGQGRLVLGAIAVARRLAGNPSVVAERQGGGEIHEFAVDGQKLPFGGGWILGIGCAGT